MIFELSFIRFLKFFHVFRFQECCSRALQSAVDLAAWASGFEAESLKKYYQQSVEVNWFEAKDAVGDKDEDDSDEEEAELRAAP